MRVVITGGCGFLGRRVALQLLERGDIDELGYAGWIGCEYRPLGSTEAGLSWRRRYGV